VRREDIAGEGMGLAAQAEDLQPEDLQPEDLAKPAPAEAEPNIWRVQAVKLAVPDMISNSYFPAIAAIELGLFKQEGLDVELELIFPVDKAYAALRDGTVDLVGGSAHSALAAFPQWRGVKLLCAQAQGMYWFLVLHRDIGDHLRQSLPIGRVAGHHLHLGAG